MSLTTNDEYREALLWLIAESGMSVNDFAWTVLLCHGSTLTRKGRGYLKGGIIKQPVREWIAARVPSLDHIRENNT